MNSITIKKCLDCGNFKDYTIEEKILNFLPLLTTREYMILLYRFVEKLSYNEIRKYFGVSAARIKEIERKTFRKIFYKFPDLNEEEMSFIIDKHKESLPGLITKQVLAVGPRSDIENLLLVLKVKLLPKKIEIEPEVDVENIHIDALRLSVRTHKCLTSHGINTIGQLMELSADDILKIRNLGHRSYEEIKEALAAYKLCFKGFTF